MKSSSLTTFSGCVTLLAALALLVFYFTRKPSNYSLVEVVPSTPKQISTAKGLEVSNNAERATGTIEEQGTIATNVDYNGATSEKVAAKASTAVTTQPTELFMVTTNPREGLYAVVNMEAKSVTLKDKQGNSIWSTNLVAAAQASEIPILGATRIYGMRLVGENLIVRVGKADFLVSVRTGHVVGSGSY